MKQTCRYFKMFTVGLIVRNGTSTMTLLFSFSTSVGNLYEMNGLKWSSCSLATDPFRFYYGTLKKYHRRRKYGSISDNSSRTEGSILLQVSFSRCRGQRICKSQPSNQIKFYESPIFLFFLRAAQILSS